jgi:hypothetical protein
MNTNGRKVSYFAETFLEIFVSEWTSCSFLTNIVSPLFHGGVRWRSVFKALSYKPAGRGFDSWWCHWKFSVT